MKDNGICKSFALLVLAPALLAAQAPQTPSSFAAVLKNAESSGFAGVVVAGDLQQITFESAVGVADRAKNRPHRTGDRWPWASVTKQVTAALVMAQVDAGRISLDDPIKSLLPHFDGPTGDKVTVRQLLQHTSGLPNPSDGAAGGKIPDFYRATGAGISDSARTSGFCSGTPKAEPGIGFSYNNCDYLVLGALLERVTGKPYPSLVREALARPLGMKSLRQAPDGAPLGGSKVAGYLDESGSTETVNFATWGASAALVGTAHDLIRFNRALMTNKLVSPAATADMWRGDPKLGYAALGAWSFPAKLNGCQGNVDLVERRGSVAGIQVRNIMAPALGRSVVAFTNNGSFDFGEIWQGRGFSHDLASAAFCTATKS